MMFDNTHWERNLHAITMNAIINVRDWCHINEYASNESSYTNHHVYLHPVGGRRMKAQWKTQLSEIRLGSNKKKKSSTGLTNITAQCMLLIKSQISIANMHELHPWHTFRSYATLWTSFSQCISLRLTYCIIFFFCLFSVEIFRLSTRNSDRRAMYACLHFIAANVSNKARNSVSHHHFSLLISINTTCVCAHFFFRFCITLCSHHTCLVYIVVFAWNLKYNALLK